ncbi:hypothetical protein D3C83_126600 [compost metagenome]
MNVAARFSPLTVMLAMETTGALPLTWCGPQAAHKLMRSRTGNTLPGFMIDPVLNLIFNILQFPDLRIQVALHLVKAPGA